jgi:hypothetical protein
MRIEDLPQTTLVGHAVEVMDLGGTLSHCGIRWPVRHIIVAHGLPRSVRILSAEPIEGESVTLPKPMWILEMAGEFFRLTDKEARYDAQPTKGHRKGWEIRSGQIGDVPILVAMAAWV